MLLEDLQDLDGADLTPDLTKLLHDVNELLARLDGPRQSGRDPSETSRLTWKFWSRAHSVSRVNARS
jgi:hypothetical protein